MAKYSAMQIAHWFIKRNQEAMENEGADPMTLLKLLKLLYYAEGCYLAINNGEKLFDEKIVAWEHGPVVEEVYHAFPNPYNLDVSDDELADADQIDEDVQNLLEQVFVTFGKYSAWALRNKTHEEDPWRLATDNGQRLNGEIDQNIMQEYFAKNYVQ